MRLYAVADIHGRSDRMTVIKSNLEKYRPNALVAAGDITTFRKASFVSALGDLSLPVLALRGNTDLKRVESWFALKENILFLNNRDVTLQGTHFAGVSGTIPIPFRSRIAFRETADLEPADSADNPSNNTGCASAALGLPGSRHGKISCRV